jgi:hypothetical protein
MVLRCSICNEGYLPWGRWHEDWCAECWTRNFKDSQEWRLHDEEGQPLTERQRQAALRLAVAQAREAEHQRYAVECAAALRQRMAGGA